jgi:hypothetical protein
VPLETSEGSVSAAAPKVLYHYTSFEGLLGILEKKAIWASSVHHMSDAREISFALDQFRKLALGQESENQVQLDPDFTTGLERVLLDLKLPIDRIGKDMNLVYTYVASFCQERDRLSQWRAYCPTAGGVAIGFNSGKLESLARRNKFRLVKCLYDDSCQRERIWSFLASLCTQVKSELEASRKPQRSEILRQLLGDHDAIWEHHVEIVRCAAELKHRGFSEELEWRLVSEEDHREAAFLSEFRATKATVVPYRSIPLADQASDLPIEEIVIGPGLLKRLTAVSVWNLLLKKLMVTHCDVIMSKIEYRPSG